LKTNIFPKTKKWDSFSDWLQNDSPIYWISGKPGSGKSTLMRFLIHSPWTREMMEQREEHSKTIAAFIWAAGSLMQRSLKGLLCTLLYGLIIQAPQLIHDTSLKQFTGNKRAYGDWSIQELEHTFSGLVRNQSQSLLVFIDGLDEIEPTISEGQRNLLELIKRLSTLPKIKICVASRPEPLLDSRLRGHPHLRLQNLTRKDVEAYVRFRLASAEMSEWLDNQLLLQTSEAPYMQPSLDRLVLCVTDRAEGIFLWVALVTNAIQTGILNYDDWNMLLQRVNSLPSDLIDLYEDLWRRQKDISEEYRASAAKWFNIILDAESNRISFLEMLFITDLELQQRLIGGGSYVSNVEIVTRCQNLRRQIIGRCCGLLEIEADFNEIDVPHLFDTPIFGNERLLSYRVFDIANVSARFIHRSARDFLVDTTKGKDLCRNDHSTPLKRRSECVLGLLGAHIALGIPENDHYESRYGATTLPFLYKRFLGEMGIYARLVNCSLDLWGASLNRIPEWRSSPLISAKAAADQGLLDFAAYLLAQDGPRSTIEATEVRSSLLLSLILGMWRYSPDDGYALIDQLLEQGADPNAIVLSQNGPTNERIQPPCASSKDVWVNYVMPTRDDFRKLVSRLLQGGMDPNQRFLSNASTPRSLLNFPDLPVKALGALGERNVAVLCDITYCHVIPMEIAEALGDACEDLGHTACSSFDSNRVAPIRPVMLVEVTLPGDDRHITRLRAKIVDQIGGLSLMEDVASLRLKNSRSTDEICEYFDSHPGDILDEDGMVRWMVEKNYLPPSALQVEDKLHLLVGSNYKPSPFQYPHDRSAVDYSYRSEYGRFVEEVDACIADGLDGTQPIEEAEASGSGQ
jgi:hypothetical protein